MFKTKKTGELVYKMSKPFQHKGIEYVEVLVPYSKRVKSGNKATIQTMKVSNLIDVNKQEKVV